MREKHRFETSFDWLLCGRKGGSDRRRPFMSGTQSHGLPDGHSLVVCARPEQYNIPAIVAGGGDSTLHGIKRISAGALIAGRLAIDKPSAAISHLLAIEVQCGICPSV